LTNENNEQIEDTADYISQLDEQQRAAVLAPTDQPILVIAAAGSGKTTVLTSRVAHLVKALEYDPSSIIVTTFTRAAADELKSRLSTLIGTWAARKIQASTIHSLCLTLLRGHLRQVDIIDRAVQRRIIEEAANDAYMARGIKQGDKRRLGWRYWVGWVDWAKVNGVTEMCDFHLHMIASRPDIVGNRLLANIASEVTKSYERAKGALYDFTDILTKTRDLLDDPATLSGVQERYRYCLIDELQDTSLLQMDILSKLGGNQHIFGVGDGSQALYAWNGASPEENIFGWLDRFPNGQVYPLSTNYRSTKSITNPASVLIHNNYLVEGKEKYESGIHPYPDAEEGMVISRNFYETARDEANVVGMDISTAIAHGDYPQDFYVIARTNAALAPIEEFLTLQGIPVISTGGSFWDNPKIQDVIAYISLAHEVTDDGAFIRVYDIPSPKWDLTTRRLGRKFLERVQNFEQGESMWERMQEMYTGETAFRRRAIADFMNYIGTTRNVLHSKSLANAVQKVCDDYTTYYQKREGTLDLDDLDVLEALPSIAKKFDSWPALKAHINFMRQEKDKKRDESVVLSTVHGVKGLERRVVYGIGLSEGLLPHWMVTGDSIEMEGDRLMNRDDMPPSTYDGGIEDERCAAYVLITRAKEELHLSGSVVSGRKVNMAPSRFFKEMGFEVEPPPPWQSRQCKAGDCGYCFTGHDEIGITRECSCTCHNVHIDGELAEVGLIVDEKEPEELKAALRDALLNKPYTTDNITKEKGDGNGR